MLIGKILLSEVSWEELKMPTRCVQVPCLEENKQKNKLRGLCPRANYTDRAPTFANRRYHMVSVTDPEGRILGFLDRSRYFSFQEQTLGDGRVM
jgi:hypothetical protein